MVVFKKISVLLVIIAYILILVGCKQKNPEITSVITLSNISNDDFIKISKSSIPEGATMNDLKKLYIDVKMSDSKKATERTINIPDLYIIDGYDRVRSTSGYSASQNNIGSEDTSESSAWVIFDTRGLTEKDLMEIYKKSEIYISYKFKNSKLVEDKIPIGENITINN